MCQELLKCQGWDRLVEYAEGQMAARTTAMQGAANGLDGLIAEEFSKGEVAGIRLFLNIPSVIIRDFSEQIEELLEEENNG